MIIKKIPASKNQDISVAKTKPVANRIVIISTNQKFLSILIVIKTLAVF